MTIALTGATGYLGRRVVRKAFQRNYSVVSLGRRPLEGAAQHIYWDISNPSHVEFPKGCSGVFHLAINPSGWTERDYELELNASVALLRSACQQSIPFFFISSHAALENGPTAYGRTKWKIERRVLESGGWVIRLGQIYGGPVGGVFGRLDQLVRRFPVLPRLIPDPKIRPLHVDDAAAGIFKLLECPSGRPRVLCWGAIDPVGFSYFLSKLASERQSRAKLFIPFPAFFIRWPLLVMGEKVREMVGLNRLFSLLNLPRMDTARDMKEFCVPVRRLQSGLSRSGKERRGLLREGERFIRQIMKSRPQPSLLKRYLRAIETLRDGVPLNLPSGRWAFEAYFSILEAGLFRPDSFHREFRWRLNAAMVLSEATVEGAERFLGPFEGRSKIKVFRILMGALMAELLWRMVALAARPFTKGPLKNEMGPP